MSTPELEPPLAHAPGGVISDIRVLFFGDSFVAGVGDPTGLGLVGRLAQAAWKAGSPLTAYNLGIRRDTSLDVAQRWRRETDTRLAPEAANAVVFAFGANDAVMERGQRRVPASVTVATLARVLDEARTAGLPSFVIGPVPVAVDPRHADRALGLTRQFEELCAARAVPFAAVNAALAESDDWRREALTFDGAHPAQGGYELLAQRVLAGGWLNWISKLDARGVT